ncbi:hypothetical protein TGAM01_v209463 [Trichoderma gamsii]|uniref:Uncharacterized protein n=1 Tax=Trichoderma gamsii TaxID=398673 RepID=A0A2P4ZBT5_9HYPO|nr:hypothetical protein TGAM01_v209463 [Trichoderma gamsii]PON21725.1 hypothetical protein TGAM01_v209463 [Trichoderma gamsii]
MSKYAEMAKGKLSEGREKASGLKGRAKGKVTRHIPGRGHKEEEDIGASHVARPLSSLRDPNSFAPPPRRTGSGLAPPPPPSTAKRSVVKVPGTYQPAYEEEEEEHHIPTGPYRADTTGLSTSNLPPPPVRRDHPNDRSPPPYESVVASSAGTRAPPPSLPPRLPPRSGSGTPGRTESPLSALGANPNDLNQGAINRLGAAGISVPAFGIGKASPSYDDDDAPPPPKPPRPVAAPPPQSHLNELQNRFARLGTSNTGSSAGSPTPPSETTTPPAVRPAAPFPAPAPSGSPGLAGKKKPPPPPPKKKKPTLSAAAVTPPANDEPPPIPLSTRPSYQ